MQKIENGQILNASGETIALMKSGFVALSFDASCLDGYGKVDDSLVIVAATTDDGRGLSMRLAGEASARPIRITNLRHRPPLMHFQMEK